MEKHDSKNELLLVNRRGRPFSANKLREKVLHPLLVNLGIPRGGFHSMRHGATSALLADGTTPAVVQKQLRHSDARITLGIYGHVIGSQEPSAKPSFIGLRKGCPLSANDQQTLGDSAMNLAVHIPAAASRGVALS